MEANKVYIKGKSLEFGAYKNQKKNFSTYLNGKKNFQYTNLKKDKKNNILKGDLDKKLKFKSNHYQNLIIFNVLEHLSNPIKSLKELHRILKRGGLLIGSTPFLYQVHGAPNDYLRFTKNYLINEFKKKKFKAIYVKELGYGPFLAAFSILFPYFKFLPIINYIIFLMCLIFDSFLQIFIKTKLREIFPIGIFFIFKKM
ncbi:class I SAM-dependent methyltransferase [Candidatus Pelagibacter sp.]|nr:class I SAM-dependent methyltransferase [Candidatus Pelagibacter sp.]